MPQAGFLFSIAGIGVSLAGFSGLALAFRRGAPLKAVDAFRLRELPEMALAATFLALLTIPLLDTFGGSRVAIQIASGLALLFTLGHIVRLVHRARIENISQPPAHNVLAGLVDAALLLVAAASLALGTAAVYEWVLIFMLARPALSFVFVLTEVAAG